MKYSDISTTKDVIISPKEQSPWFLWLSDTFVQKFPPTSVCLHSSNATEVLHLLCTTVPWSSDLQPSDSRAEIFFIAEYLREYRTSLVCTPTQ